MDESPGLWLTTQVKGCSMGLNRPVRNRLQDDWEGENSHESPPPNYAVNVLTNSLIANFPPPEMGIPCYQNQIML